MKTMTYSESRAHARTSMRIGLPASRRCCSEDFSVGSAPSPAGPNKGSRGSILSGCAPACSCRPSASR